MIAVLILAPVVDLTVVMIGAAPVSSLSFRLSVFSLLARLPTFLATKPRLDL